MKTHAEEIVSELIKSSVRNFFLTNNNSELSQAIINNPLSDTLTDQNIFSYPFVALGWAKATQKVACILYQESRHQPYLYPVITKAKKENIPIIFLSPKEILPDILPNIPLDPKNKSAVSQSVHLTKKFGPICLNYNLTKCAVENWLPIPVTTYHYSKKVLNKDSTLYMVNEISTCDKGILVLGEMVQYSPTIIDFANKLNWPILADAFSESRHLKNSIRYYNLLKIPNMSPTLIIHLGEDTRSTTLTKLLNQTSKYYIVGEASINHATDQIDMTPVEFCSLMLEQIDNYSPSKLTSCWKNLSPPTNQSFIERVYSFLNNLKISYLLFGGVDIILHTENLYFPKNPVKLFKSETPYIVNTAIGIYYGLKQSLIVVTDVQSLFTEINNILSIVDKPLAIIFLVFVTDNLDCQTTLFETIKDVYKSRFLECNLQNTDNLENQLINKKPTVVLVKK